MRPSTGIAAAAALLIACLVPVAGHADGRPGPAAAARPPGCHCPQAAAAARHHVWRRRHMRYRASARRWRYPPSAAIVAAPAPVQPTYFNAPIPSPWNPAYDRAMVLLLRSPAVTGIYIADPGYPPTPPVAGIKPYEYAAAGGAVFQYDDLVGKYVQLSQYDAQRNFALPPPLPYPAGP